MYTASLVRIIHGLALVWAVFILLFLQMDGVSKITRAFESENEKYDTSTEPSGNKYASLPRLPPSVGATDNGKDATKSESHQDNELPVLLSATDPARVIKVYRTFNDMGKLAGLFFGGTICQAMFGSDLTLLEQNAKLPTVVNITVNCNRLFEKMPYGTGNLMMTLYAIRATARATGMTDVMMHCADAQEHQGSLILPWLMGIFPRPFPNNDDHLAAIADDEATEQRPTVNDACEYKLPPPMRGAIVLGWILDEIRFELRRMAIAMMGIPSPDHPSAAWADENLWSNPALTHRHGRNYMQLPHPKKGQIPLHPTSVAQVDDAMLHFRCGDLVNSASAEMGFMKFSSYSRHLSSDVRSIGIATQPFEADALQTRTSESLQVNRYRCKVIVDAFVEHLRERFPNAQVSVHNSRNETIALTFARMIMANQTVVGISSFGVFPALTTFGTGYIRHVENDLHEWLVTPPMLQRLENVVLIQEPILKPGHLKRRWGENGAAVLEWFKN